MNESDQGAVDPFYEPHACAKPAGECCSHIDGARHEEHGCTTCPEGHGRLLALMWPLLLALLLGTAAAMARILS